MSAGEYSNVTGGGGGGRTSREYDWHQKVQDLERRLTRVETDIYQRTIDLEMKVQELSSFMHYTVRYHPAVVAEWNNVTQATKRVLGEEPKGLFNPP